MSLGWKFEAASFSLETSGMMSATQNLFVDAVYGPGGGCGSGVTAGNGPDVFSIESGNGHVSAMWNAAADLTTGGPINGAMHKIIPGGGFSGSILYRVRDANNVLLVNKTYSKKDIDNLVHVTDAFSILVDPGTYDPNLAQYANLQVELSFSGKIPATGVGNFSGLYGCA